MTNSAYLIDSKLYQKIQSYENLVNSGGGTGEADTEQNIEWVDESQMPADGVISFQQNNGELPNMYLYVKSIVVPDGVKRLGDGCFGGYDKLESVVLPDTLESIGGGAFNGCLSLKKLTIPSKCQIGGGAFTNALALEEIELSEGIEILGAGAFANTIITSITIPSTVNYIDSVAFPNVTTLTEINILAPKSQVQGADNAPWGATNATVNWING